MTFDPASEPRETSGITSRLILSYTELVGGRPGVQEVLRQAGLACHEDFFRDENSWFSFATKVRLFEAAAVALDDPDVMLHMGQRALELNVGEGLKVALRALGTPGLVYRNIVRANAKFTASHQMELLALGRDHASIRYMDIVGAGFHPLDCQYNRGLLACIPALFGQPYARVNHPRCAGDGAEACVYDLSWDRSAGQGRLIVAAGAMGVGSLAAAALAAPALLPVAAAAAAGAAGAVALRGRAARQARWRWMESELREQSATTDRLSAALHDLVSELRLDEVLAKITSNARAAVGGKEFALLVEEGQGLSCLSSTGLPAESVSTLEGWAGGMSRVLSEPVLVDDVTLVPELASLASNPAMPLGSVCAAPLVSRGRSLGALVALSTQPRTFLPRDIDLVRAYAAQGAIALTNARLYEAQEQLATRDPLTGLLNHREFHEALDRELERSRRSSDPFAVVLLDLDRFKAVNDANGHAAGDRVLRSAAEAIAAACRGGDVAFRVGGDEFALLLPGTGPEDAPGVAERTARAVAALDMDIGASYGVASWPADGWSKDVLLSHADRRLYEMKPGALRVQPPREAVSALTLLLLARRERGQL
jgi:diguanylate cyclase (GGDEF)-like protein